MYLVLKLRKIKLTVHPVFLSVFTARAALLVSATNFGAGFRFQQSKAVCVACFIIQF